ncbi:hypothetical protein R0K04_08150 [Pseudoalteromonas sp. SIMBA_153]
MRHIDKRHFSNCKTKTWDKKAIQWSRKIAASADPKATIEEIGNKWSSLKRTFVQEFGAKCWYTETPQIGTDFDVDHYWPKGRVKLEDGTILCSATGQHPGYWWKAFDIDNYRYSCIYANRSREDGGKVDYFPLIDESQRAWGDTTCDYNYRTILDPCSLGDVQLITFEVETGKTVSIYSEQQDSKAYQRVKLSKNILNLDEESIVSARIKSMRKIRKALQCLKLSHGINDLDADDLKELEDAKELIIEGCDRKSEFSAAIVQTVLPHTKRPYLACILPQLDLMP